MKNRLFFLTLIFLQCFTKSVNAQSWVVGTGGGAGNLYTSTTSANVGIGMSTTTATLGKLDIRTYGGTATVHFTSANDQFPRMYMGGTSTSVAGVINRVTTGATIYMGEDADTGGYQFRGKGYTNIGSGRIAISSSNGGTCLGCVGIGTTTPLYKLHVAGVTRIVNASSGTVGYIDLIPVASGSNPTSIEIASAGSANSAQIDFKGYTHLGSDFYGRLKYTDGTGFAFQTTGSTTDKVVITEAGYVGIGITPASLMQLHVEGGFSKFSSGSGYVGIVHSGSITLGSTGDPQISFITPSYLPSTIRGKISYTDVTGFDFMTGAATVKMRIKDDGKIIMGDPSTVTTPSGYVLYVDGGILCEKVKVALCCTTDWSDFVFDPDYEMLSLDSVEKFVNTNCHLPGVPSADEIVKEGIDVAKMDALLLQKIEELTLYMIQLSKENDDLKAEIEELKKK